MAFPRVAAPGIVLLGSARSMGCFYTAGPQKKIQFFLLAGNHTSLQIRAFHDAPKSAETKSYVANYMSCARSSRQAPEWEEYYSALNEQDAALASGLNLTFK